jgi:Flp pilus assembly protein TadD
MQLMQRNLFRRQETKRERHPWLSGSTKRKPLLQWRAVKRFLLVGSIVLVLAGTGAWLFGRSSYRHYRELRSLRLAREYLAKSDYRNAWLSSRQVLALNSTNLEACRIMADLSEVAGSPAVVIWRRKVAELEPTLTNRLLLASCALRHEAAPFPLATATLESVKGTKDVTNQTAFQVVAAERALRLNMIEQAEHHFQEAMRLDPTNSLHALNLAVLRLQSTNAATAAQARTRLQALAEDPHCGIAALRTLAADSANRRDWAAATDYSKRVLADTNSTFADRVQHLSILWGADGGRKTEDGGRWTAYLETLQKVAGTNLSSILELGNWLNAHELAAETHRWLTRLPAATKKQLPVPLILADAYLNQKDWATLKSWLPDQNWEEQEFSRLALLALAWRSETAGEAVAKVHWRKAMRAASQSPATLAALAEMARSWGWTNEVGDVLWETANRYPNEAWAAQGLEKELYLGAKTRALLTLYSILLEHHPKDPVAMNNVATVSMLLKTNLDTAHELARSSYAHSQTNPAIASTYAFSLYLQGKTNEALAVISRLREDDLRRGSVAAYYSVILKAAGRMDQAQTYRALGEQALLLPEERQLLAW